LAAVAVETRPDERNRIVIAETPQALSAIYLCIIWQGPVSAQQHFMPQRARDDAGPRRREAASGAVAIQGVICGAGLRRVARNDE
jgi:hypothetical protein